MYIYDEHFVNNKEDERKAKSFDLDIYIYSLNQYYCFINLLSNLLRINFFIEMITKILRKQLLFKQTTIIIQLINIIYSD